MKKELINETIIYLKSLLYDKNKLLSSTPSETSNAYQNISRDINVLETTVKSLQEINSISFL